MAQFAPPEVCAPRSLQAWRALIDWLTFFVQVVAQIARGAPSIAQVLSYFGLRRPLLASSSPSFKPLPVVELPLHHSSELLENSCSVVADAGGGVGDSFRPLEKLTVVLDLDETLVCAYETFSLPTIIRTQATEAGLKWFDLECVSSDKECAGKPKISYVTVFERPGLREFLKQIGEVANLVLFTAGVEGYAKPLVDRIDTENRISLRLYRPSTVSTEGIRANMLDATSYPDPHYRHTFRWATSLFFTWDILGQHREHVKDLSCLSKDLSRVIIVDNNPFSFLLQPTNGIPCIPFSAAQPCDDQLLEVILPLLKDLALREDVRPALHEKFRMPEWFRIHGIPVSG